MSNRRQSFRFSNLVLAASTVGVPFQNATAASSQDNDPAKRELIDYARALLQENCSAHESYDPASFHWNEYDEEILWDLISSLEEQTGNFCSPPEITTMAKINSRVGTQ